MKRCPLTVRALLLCFVIPVAVIGCRDNGSIRGLRDEEFCQIASRFAAHSARDRPEGAFSDSTDTTAAMAEQLSRLAEAAPAGLAKGLRKLSRDGSVKRSTSAELREVGERVGRQIEALCGLQLPHVG